MKTLSSFHPVTGAKCTISRDIFLLQVVLQFPESNSPFQDIPSDVSKSEIQGQY